MRWLVALYVCACATASSDPRDRFADHIAALRKRLADKGLGKMQIRIEGPFVVVGDTSAAALEREARTVRWATSHLEADFFAARPKRKPAKSEAAAGKRTTAEVRVQQT